MADSQEINPHKIAVDLDRTLILGDSGNEVILRPGAILLLESLLELDYNLALYTHASENWLITVLNSVPDLEDFFEEIYIEKDMDRRYGPKDPGIIKAKFLIDDQERNTRSANELGFIGILVSEYVDRNDNSEQWAHEVLSQIKNSK